MRETKSQKKPRTEQIIKLLKRAHPDAHCALNHSNAFELLMATILSAQCTDERVNIVTADLFRKYRKPEDYLKVSRNRTAAGHSHDRVLSQQDGETSRARARF